MHNITYNIIADNAAKQTGIFLSNEGGGHFESVRRYQQVGNNDPYLFTRNELLVIQQTQVDPKHRNIRSNPCTFIGYDIIEKLDTKIKYVVIERIFPVSQSAISVKCSSIRIVPLINQDNTKITENDILKIRALDTVKTQAEYIAKTTEIKENEFVNYNIISTELVNKDFNSRASKIVEAPAAAPAGPNPRKTKGGNYKKNKTTRKHNAKKRPSKKSSRRR
jgi:hypothetical protein